MIGRESELIAQLIQKVKQNEDRVNLISLVSLLLITPILLFPYSVLPFFAIGWVALWAILRWTILSPPKIHPGDGSLSVLLLMAVVSTIISIDTSLSWPRLWSIVLGLIIYFELRRSLNLQKQANWITAGLILVGMGLAGVSLVGTDWSQVRLIDLPWLYDKLPTFIRGLPDSGALQSYGELFHPRWVGIIMGVLAPVFLPIVIWGDRLWHRILGGLTFFVATITLILTQSIQGVLGLLAGTLLVLTFVSKWYWLTLPIGIEVLVGFIHWFRPENMAAKFLSMNDVAGIAVVLRLDIWSRAWAMIRDMPFTGIGLNTFPLIQSQFYTGYLIGPEANAHNLYLQTALDLGIPGLIAFISFFGWWIYRIIRRIKEEGKNSHRLLLISALAGVIAYLAHGVMDAMMLGAKPSFAVWILLGIGVARSATYQEISPQKKYTRLAIYLVIPLALGALVLFHPASIYMNLGALQTHRLLNPFPYSQIDSPEKLETAQNNLEKAIELDPSLSQADFLLARISSFLEDFPTAYQYYRQMVALDIQDPIAKYNPTLQVSNWFAQSNPHVPAAELRQIYQAWNTRFPERAEGYLLNSIVAGEYQANPVLSQALLKTGINADAKPEGLLQYVIGLE